MTTHINISQQVRCKLTDAGRSAYQAYFDRTTPSAFVPPTAELECTMPLWLFAEVFGALLMKKGSALLADNNLELIG